MFLANYLFENGGELSVTKFARTVWSTVSPSVHHSQKMLNICPRMLRLHFKVHPSFISIMDFTPIHFAPEQNLEMTFHCDHSRYHGLSF